MLVLGIETSTYAGSVALIEDERVVGEVFINLGPSHSEKLLPIIEWLLREVGLNKEDVEGIAVSIGPGSFTSVRVGVATAKGLAFSLGVPVVGVSSLEVLALNFPFAPFVICSIIDARKGEVFMALFRSLNGSLERISEDTLVRPEHLISIIREKTIFVGDGTLSYRELLKDSLGELALFSTPGLNFPRASNCALIGIERLKKGQKDDVFSLAPKYLRKSEAEILKEKRGEI
ncbi:MAG: tRNA (adenosine(37)-N6)-threonylcarbamoyltransferase complex dimerization subunit type 1 TsaB [Deltaproteobacteria bacterium]|nr:MAG: tRNA (adenosine(37)-N6)-threonylcarbamoyltransferase complex dimerization subunit type 1 TsaB [Deltaproteobacteria bacterium]